LVKLAELADVVEVPFANGNGIDNETRIDMSLNKKLHIATSDVGESSEIGDTHEQARY
jgi:hypothetical protein